MDVVTDSISNNVADRVSLDAKLSDLLNIMNRISAQAINLRKLIENQNGLNPNTLMEFSTATTSFNSLAMQPLLDQMHMLVTGSSEHEIAGHKSLLAQFATYFQVRFINFFKDFKCLENISFLLVIY